MTEKAIEILDVHPINKGAAKARVKIFITKWDLEINNIMIFGNDRGMWLGMPSKEFQNEEGKKCFAPYIKFRSEERKEAFRKAVIAEYMNTPQPVQAAPKQEEEFNLF